MSRRAVWALWGSVVMVLACPLAAAAGEPLLVERFADARAPEAWLRDDEGRLSRVAFDPGTALELGVMASLAAVVDEAAAVEATLLVDLQLRDWLVWGSDGDSTRVSWQLDHHVLAGAIALAEPARELPALEVALYRGEYLRHDELPHITIPDAPPVLLPFPFDLGLEAEILRLRTGPGRSGPRHEALSLEVARAALLLDPWRTGRPGDSLELGLLGVGYHIALELEPGRDPDLVEHRVAPLTATSVRFRLQDAPGLTRLDSRVDLVPYWSSARGWGFAASAALELERVLFSVNDHPFALRLDARYAHRAPAGAAAALDELQARLGLVYALPLD